VDLYALTESDHDALGRLFAEWQAGRFTRQHRSGKTQRQRVYEAVPFINAAGEAIPAYGVMRVTTPTTVDGEMVFNVTKPDATYRWRYLINGPDAVDSTSGAKGWGTWIFDGDKVLYDTSATPALGERWGPKSGEWKLFQHRPGFLLDGRYNSTDGVLWAMQLPPGEVRVKNDDGGGALAADSSRTFGVYGGSAGTTDTGLEVTLTNGSSTSWAANKYGFATADAGGIIFGAPHQT
jgi:hypothetical protein